MSRSEQIDLALTKPTQIPRHRASMQVRQSESIIQQQERLSRSPYRLPAPILCRWAKMATRRGQYAGRLCYIVGCSRQSTVHQTLPVDDLVRKMMNSMRMGVTRVRAPTDFLPVSEGTYFTHTRGWYYMAVLYGVTNESL